MDNDLISQVKKGEADSVRVLCSDGMSYTELGTVVGEYVCVGWMIKV